MEVSSHELIREKSLLMKVAPAKVLFICIGNSCRSPMAEGIARKDFAGVLEASSAGLAPLGFVAEMTKKTLARNGYPVEGLESKPISREAWEAADIVVNMSGRPREMVFTEYGKVEDWDIEDPYGDDLQVYQRTCEKIQLQVIQLANRLRERSE